MNHNINLGDLVNEVIEQTKDLDTNYSILSWFNQAKPSPSDQNTVQQMAYHFEEVSEMLDAIHCDYMAEQMRELKAQLLSYDKNQCTEFLATTDKLELLDSLADQIVTSLGVGYMMGFDMQGALNEVNQSNWSKFEDGKPVINEQGKIIKGKDYFKPNLEPHL